MAVMEKCLGMSRAFASIVKRIKLTPPDAAFPIYTVFSLGRENCDTLEHYLGENGFPSDERLRIGASIGTHVGPGATGVIYIAQEA